VTEDKERQEQSQEKVEFTIPWSEKREEFGTISADEEMIARAWEMNEDLVFFFLMWLGTY
jgi:hypothetical protein